MSVARSRLISVLVAKTNRIGDPLVDGGLAPASAMDADPDLTREGALGDLAIHGRSGEASAGKHGFEADNSFWVGHGMHFHSLTVIGSP